MIIEKEIVLELSRVIKGFNFFSKMKEEVRSQLSKKIDDSKVDELLNESITIENLSDEEQYHFLKVVFEKINDERFNPVAIRDKEIVAKIKKKKNDEDLSKDDMPELYFDFDFKTRFAQENYNPETRKVVLSLFRKTAQYEKSKAKDLYEFEIKELREVLRSLKAKTIRSLQNSISTIERYIKFAQDNNRLEHKFNYASSFDSKRKIEDLLDKEAEENMIFDKDEIMDMALNSDNVQDGVILGLIFDGVSHKNEFEEVTNLTKNNIDFNNKEIKLEDRIIPMSHETKMLVEDALKQDTPYISITGEKTRKYKVAEGDNVVRGLRGKAKVKGQIISQRILRIAEIWSEKYLNATTISYSGQIHYAKELLDSGHNIEETINKVLIRFGVPINTSSQFYLRTRLEKHLGLDK